MISTEQWSGRFGDVYTERQQIDTSERRHFWNALVDDYAIESVLEVGCNTGSNLIHLFVPSAGVDVNEQALAHVPRGIRVHKASATDLPFEDDEYDLVLTFGCLIHIPTEDLRQAMSEIVRVARRYVFCAEYYGSDSVPYRGGELWRRPYGYLYENLGLEEVEKGRFKGEPWDRNRVDWWFMRQKEWADA